MTTVFPTNGSANAAALFALLAGHPNATDFVGDGLTISVDTSTNEASFSSGTCYIRVESETVVGTDESVRDLGYVVQIDTQTLSIPSTGTVTVAVVPDFSTPDAATLDYYDTQAGVPDEALSIADIDCNSGTVTTYNRAPDIDAETLTVVGDTTVGGELTVEGALTLEDTLQRADGTVLLGPNTDIPTSEIESDSVTINTSGDLTGGGTVSLGDSLTLGTDVPVTSVYGRTGAVTAASGDYTHEQIANVQSDDHHQYPVPNSGIANTDITVSTTGDLTGGGSVSLGESLSLGVDVHERYTDTEAVSAVNENVSVGSGTVTDLDSAVSDLQSDVSSIDSNNDGTVDAAETAETATTAEGIEVRSSDPDNPDPGQLWIID